MRAAMRRGAREILDDAMERVRRDAAVVTVLHVLPSLPFFAALLLWSVELDLRGAMPGDEALGVVVLLVPKLLGWAALSAWAAHAARGRSISIGGAWRRVLRRFPEGLLATSLALLAIMLAPFTLGLSLLLGTGALVGLAAGVGPSEAGGVALVRQAVRAALPGFTKGVPFVVLLSIALVFLVINLLVLPFLAVQLGAGGLGLDLTLLVAALRPDRAAAWAFACMAAALVVEAVLVVTCAEWQYDEEAEREGARFAAFADELEQAIPDARRERAA